MRILYGITANGNGHLARSGRIVDLLRSRGHEVELVVSGEPGKKIMNGEELSPFVRMEAFSFVRGQAGVSLARTILAARPVRFLADLLVRLPRGPFDLAVTDYEPLVAWKARLHGIPSVGISHMYAYLHPGVPAPPASWLERLAFRWLAPADLMLGIHWWPYHPLVLPPFVPPIDSRAEEARRVLVYLPWEDPGSYLPALRELADWRFVVFGEREGAEHNILFLRQERPRFLAELGRAASVVANAGFALASEALSAGKRLVLKPFAGQVEQEHNAREAERLGLASRLEAIEPAALRAALEGPRPPAFAFPDISLRFVEWLERGGRVLDAATGAAFWGLPADGPRVARGSPALKRCRGEGVEIRG